MSEKCKAMASASAADEPARPRPIADATSRPYWDAAAEGRLVMQRCRTCRLFQHPPGPICRHCYAASLEFEEISGRVRVYSYTVSHVAFVPGFEAELPLVIALLEIEEQPGLRVLGNVRGVPVEEMRVGMELSVVFEDIGGGVTLPQFAPRRTGQTTESSQT